MSERQEASPWQWPGFGPLALALLLVAGAAFHAWMLLSNVTLVSARDGWFYPFRDKPAGSPAVLAFLVWGPWIALIGMWLVTRRPRNPHWLVLALVVLGALLQHGLALTEGRGLEGMRDRIATSGHAEFARDASRGSSIEHLLVNYESLVDSGELSRYAKSKPPGQELFYFLTERAARLFRGAGDGASGRLSLETFASLVWPFVASLALVPLFLLGRAVWDERTALLACTLYLFVPSFGLVTLHTDQVFFPLLFLGPLVLVMLAARRNSVYLALGAGALAYLAVFCSFGLAVVGIFLFVFAVAAIPRSRPGESPSALRRTLPRIGIGVALGALLVDALFRAGFGYDVLLRWSKSLAHHEEWKRPFLERLSLLQIARVNLLEYALWSGVPLTLLSLVALGRLVRRPSLRFQVPGSGLAPVLVATTLFLALFSRTVGEVARLWLFLVPLACLVGARELLRREDATARWMIPLVLALQAGSVYLTKTHMDFW